MESPAAKAARSEFETTLAKAERAWREARRGARERYATALTKAFDTAMVAKDLGEALAIKLEQKKVAADLKGEGAIREMLAAKASSIYKQFTWKAGDPPVKMLAAIEGFCFLSSTGGSFQGGGEAVKVYLKDGWWYLSGVSCQSSLWAQATSVRLRR